MQTKLPPYGWDFCNLVEGGLCMQKDDGMWIAFLLLLAGLVFCVVLGGALLLLQTFG